MLDRFDAVLIAALLGTLAWGGLLLVNGSAPGAGRATTVDKNLERAMATRARMAFLEQTYAPVSALQEQGRDEQALLKLEELERRYPGEAHGEMLRAASLQRLGALQEAVAAAVRGLRRNGDYLEECSPYSFRPQVERLVEQGLTTLAPRARRHPDNPSLEEALEGVYYLQSRLAGGCE